MTSIFAAPSVFLWTASWFSVAVVVTASNLVIFLTGTLSALGWVALPGLPCGRQGLLAPRRIMGGHFRQQAAHLTCWYLAISKRKSRAFLMDRFSQYLTLMTLPTFWVSLFWNTHQLRNGRLDKNNCACLPMDVLRDCCFLWRDSSTLIRKID